MNRFNPFDPEVRKNPYPHYQQVRRQAPVHWCAANAWLVSRYAEAEALLKDSRLTHWRRERVCRSPGSYDSRFEYYSSRWLTSFTDDATLPLKQGLRPILSGPALAELKPEIESRSRQLVASHQSTGRFDVIADFAEPLALTVVCKLLGITAEVRPDFLAVVRQLEDCLFDVIASTPDQLPPASSAPFMALMQELIQAQKVLPDGLLALLIELSQQHPEMSAADVIPFTLFFIFAGYDNMINFIGNAVLALLCHPQQWEILVEQPQYIDTAIAELLRYDSPIQLIRLTAQADLEIAGQSIQAGDDLLIAVGAANRDPAQFQHPDRLDVTRQPVTHLSFGSGPLRCLGAQLATIEAKAAISALTQSCKQIQFATDTLQWRQRPEVLRGLIALPVSMEG